MMNCDHMIFPLPGNEKFAASLANCSGWEVGQLQTRRFPDGETYLRLLSDVVGRCVDLVCTLADPDAGFLRLIFAAAAAPEAVTGHQTVGPRRVRGAGVLTLRHGLWPAKHIALGLDEDPLCRDTLIISANDICR